jgi:hypothetical protein
MVYRIKTPKIQFDILPLPDFNSPVRGGVGKVPHLVFKTFQRQRGTFSWWGVHIKHYTNEAWVQDDIDTVKRKFLATTANMPKGTSLCAELDRVISNIMDVCVRRKRPVIYGGDHSDLLQTQLINGIQFDISRERNPEVESFGGYIGYIQLFGKVFPFTFYHRGVSVQNYVDADTAIALIREYLPNCFPLMFEGERLDLGVTQSVERNRNKTGNLKRRTQAAEKVTSDLDAALTAVGGQRRQDSRATA